MGNIQSEIEEGRFLVVNIRRLTPFTCAALLCLLVPVSLPAQGLNYVKAHYTKQEHRIPMRDGARLFTAVYEPKDATQKYPILIIRTQSGLRPYGVDQYHRDLGPSSLFAKEGYI